MRYRVLVRLRSLPVQRVTVVYIVLGAAGLVGAQLVRAQLFPFKRCPRCGGTKRVKGMGGFKICTRCDKDGKVRRVGAGRQRS